MPRQVEQTPWRVGLRIGLLWALLAALLAAGAALPAREPPPRYRLTISPGE